MSERSLKCRAVSVQTERQAPVQYLPLLLIHPHGFQPIRGKDQLTEVELWRFVVTNNSSHSLWFRSAENVMASHVPELQTHHEEQTTRDPHSLLMSGSWSQPQSCCVTPALNSNSNFFLKKLFFCKIHIILKKETPYFSRKLVLISTIMF